MYFEKTKQESQVNIFKSLEIENYFRQSLKKQNFRMHKCELNFSSDRLYIFLSIYEKQNTTKPETSENINSKSELLAYKNKISKQKKDNFWENSIKSINTLTHNKFQTILRIKWVSVQNLISLLSSSAEESSIEDTKEAIVEFNKKIRIPEMQRLFLACVTQKNIEELLSNFIAEQLKKTKRHNFFFSSLIQSLKLIVEEKNSKISGIKILIKGRLNNAPRSRNKIIKIGKVPIMTQKIRKNYSESISFTSNGTIGTKIWIIQK